MAIPRPITAYVRSSARRKALSRRVRPPEGAGDMVELCDANPWGEGEFMAAPQLPQ